jgi:hypothetical protein
MICEDLMLTQNLHEGKAAVKPELHETKGS